MQTNIIYNQDCLKGMKKISSKSIDIVVTSPPYNIGKDYGKYKDNLNFDEYLNWIEKVFKEVERILKDKGSLFLNVGDKPSDEFRSFKIADRINQYFKLQNTIHWIKHIDILKEETSNLEENIAIGHYKPVNSYRFLNNSHEYIFHFTKNNQVKIDKLANGVPYKDKSNINRWKNNQKKDKRGRGNIWFIPYKTINNKKKPPASFPKELPEKCIKLHGFNSNTIVLDPFMGIGKTKKACQDLNCKHLGFEINEEYI